VLAGVLVWVPVDGCVNWKQVGPYRSNDTMANENIPCMCIWSVLWALTVWLLYDNMLLHCFGHVSVCAPVWECLTVSTTAGAISRVIVVNNSHTAYIGTVCGCVGLHRSCAFSSECSMFPLPHDFIITIIVFGRPPY
jgi:hypothetical protein